MFMKKKTNKKNKEIGPGVYLRNVETILQRCVSLLMLLVQVCGSF